MKTVFIIFVLTLNSCVHLYRLNADLYTMNDEMNISIMKSTAELRTKGYYKRISIQGKEHVPSPFAFILFEDGYFLNSGVPSDWKLPQGRWRWGKFRANADSLTIQYFEYAVSGVGFIGIFVANHTMAAQELQGNVVNDSTIFIESVKYHPVVNLKMLPIREEKFDPPLEYRFVQYLSLPKPNNWLKEVEQNKK